MCVVVRKCDGASSAEYALILSVLGAALAVGAFTLGEDISNSLNATGQDMLTCGGAC